MYFVVLLREVSVLLISHQVVGEACTALSVSEDTLLCVEIWKDGVQSQHTSWALHFTPTASLLLTSAFSSTLLGFPGPRHGAAYPIT